MIHDGTAWDESLPLTFGLKIRAQYGRGYVNERLESKRLLAIAWMRSYGKKGWVRDRVLTRPK